MSGLEVVMGIVTTITTIKTIIVTSKDAKHWIDKHLIKKNKTTSSESWLLIDAEDELINIEVGT